MWADGWLRSRALFRRKAVEAELEAELRFHLYRQAEKYLRAGLGPEEARRRARIDLGGLEQAKEECRDARGLGLLEAFYQNVRFGLRLLRHAPGFAAVAVLTLALGIGSSAAMFSVVNAVLLRPLPYPHPSQLVALPESEPQSGIPSDGASYQDLESWRTASHSFRYLAGIAVHQVTLTGRGQPTEVYTVSVTDDFFPLVGVAPLLGRTLTAADAGRGAAPVAVVSASLWRSRFGADPKIVGETVALDKRSFTVVGVMPAGFRTPFFNFHENVWIPIAEDPLFSAFLPRRGGHYLGVFGRLKPEVTLARAQAEMTGIAARLAQRYPATNHGWIVSVQPLREAIVGRQARRALLVLLAAVGLLLLIACVNVASLLLARGSGRGREMGIRVALGGGRDQLVGQLLTESAMLGLAGGLAGILLAYWGVAGLGSLLPASLPLPHAVAVDWRVLGFALALSLAASFLFGLAPAFFTAKCDPQAALGESTNRATEGASRRRARELLAAVEIALAMVLLVGAGLLLRSLAALTSVSPGFEAKGAWMAEVDLPRYQYSTPAQWSAFGGELLTRLQAQPGLRDTALAVPLPLVDGFVNLGFRIVGNPPLPPGTFVTADYVSVSPNYFRVMGIPLLFGRAFGASDSLTAPRAAVISEAFARRYFPHENPLGRQLDCGFPPDYVPRVIVGVVGDVHDQSLAQAPQPMMYVPFAQAPFWGAVVVTRTGLAPAAIAGAIRREVRAIDPDLPVTDFQSLPSGIQATAAQPRFRAELLALFGLLALALASAGIFGVISYSVSRRTHEFGIRAALGATPSSIQRMVLREGAVLALEGLAIGIAVALLLARFLQSELYFIGAADPLTYAGAAAVLAAVALAATLVPARRAMRLDPTRALRHE